jgi:hypothetical protein
MIEQMKTEKEIMEEGENGMQEEAGTSTSSDTAGQ